MYHALNQSKAIAMKRMENPRIVPLVWYREAWEEQEELVGHDPWEYGGSERNLNNMNTIAGYCHEQGLSKKASTTCLPQCRRAASAAMNFDFDGTTYQQTRCRPHEGGDP